MSMRRVRLIGFAALLVLGLAACSDDAGSFQGTTTLSPTTTVFDPHAPVVRILSPADLTPLWAETFDAGCSCIGTWVDLDGEATDPDGDSFSGEWFSSRQGSLATGMNGRAFLEVRGSDTARHVITLRVTDANGSVGEASVEVIVSIPSDTG